MEVRTRHSWIALRCILLCAASVTIQLNSMQGSWNVPHRSRQAEMTFLYDVPSGGSTFTNTKNVTNQQKDDHYHQHREYFPVPNNTIYHRMFNLNMKSADHQQKFLARKDLVNRFPPDSRFKANTHKYSAYDLTEEYAFMHLWKCGGTTVGNMGVQQHKLESQKIRTKPWIAVVRDPIEHFLSAWAEIQFRKYKLRKRRKREKFRHPETEEWMIGDYDQRVRKFLEEVKHTIWPETIKTEKTHANPQANFLMDKNGEIFDNVQVVGDLSEMKTVLTEVASFHYWIDNRTGRDSSLNKIKQQYFPRRVDLLSNSTLKALCKFHEIDYFLFAFEPPEICIEKDGPFVSWWGKV